MELRMIQALPFAIDARVQEARQNGRIALAAYQRWTLTFWGRTHPIRRWHMA